MQCRYHGCIHHFRYAWALFIDACFKSSLELLFFPHWSSTSCSLPLTSAECCHMPARARQQLTPSAASFGVSQSLDGMRCCELASLITNKDENSSTTINNLFRTHHEYGPQKSWQAIARRLFNYIFNIKVFLGVCFHLFHSKILSKSIIYTTKIMSNNHAVITESIYYRNGLKSLLACYS